MDGRPVFRSGQPNTALMAELAAAGNVTPDISRLAEQTQEAPVSPAPVSDEVQEYSPVRPFAPLVAYIGQARALAPKETDFGQSPFDPLSAPIEDVLQRSPWPGEQKSSIYAAVMRGMQQARQRQKNPTREGEDLFDPLTAPLQEVVERTGRDDRTPMHNRIVAEVSQSNQSQPRHAAKAQAEPVVTLPHPFFGARPLNQPYIPAQPLGELTTGNATSARPTALSTRPDPWFRKSLMYFVPGVDTLGQVLEGLRKLDEPASPSAHDQPERSHVGIAGPPESTSVAYATVPAELAIRSAEQTTQKSGSSTRWHRNASSSVDSRVAASNLKPVNYGRAVAPPHDAQASSSGTASAESPNQNTGADEAASATSAQANNLRQTAENARHINKHEAMLHRLRMLGRSAVFLSSAAAAAVVLSRRKNGRSH